MKYKEFLKGKKKLMENMGFAVSSVNPMLKDFQAYIVKWAVMRGRAAVFADCGLGKTPIQIDWGKHISEKTKKPVLIFAPLAVSDQTRREGDKFNTSVNICKSSKDVRPGINITNYEKIHHFDPNDFSGLVLDESSILKGFDGKLRKQITDFASKIWFRLACTATPAPNDIIEITNHSEFLGILRGKEILALYFIQDGNTTHKWRLKRHAENHFWQWLASWAIAIRKPSDLGFSDDDYNLPNLNMHYHIVDSGDPSEGMFINLPVNTLSDRRRARNSSLDNRVKIISESVNSSKDSFAIWCDLNKESEILSKNIPNAIEVRGSNTLSHKFDALCGFSNGKYQGIITKPTIAGHGMNWQHCNSVWFAGLSDSYEQYYQAIRRFWRFGQKKEVDCHIVISESERNVLENIKRKEHQADVMFENMIKHMKEYQGMKKRTKPCYKKSEIIENGKNWELRLGDSIERIKEIASNSIGFSIFSPPFPGMYAYTDEESDIGNSTDFDQLIEHFAFMMEDLNRVTMPGRSCCIHLTQGAAFKGRDGFTGLKDFRGRVIKAMQNNDWIYYGEITIDKNPQVKAIRTRDSGLQFKSLATDSSRLHVAMADYLLQFRKKGENANPIKAGISEKYHNLNGWITQEEWILWARPVWYGYDMVPENGIRETDTLNTKQAKDDKDEKHLCPLQLGVIERSVKLWSAPGEIVFSPFAGIGSEGVISLRLGRKFSGIELKKSYFDEALKNIKDADQETRQNFLI